MKEFFGKHYIEISLAIAFLIAVANIIFAKNFKSDSILLLLVVCIYGFLFYKQNKYRKEEVFGLNVEKEKIRQELKIKEKKLEEMETLNNCGRHRTDISCIGCKNLLKEHVRLPSGIETTLKFCKLDCKCEDRNDG